MATDLENLQATKSALIAARLKAAQNPSPNYSIGRQSVQFADYMKSLDEQIEAVNKLILLEDPFYIVSQGY